MKECLLCDDECENVSACPTYSGLISNFLVALQGKLGYWFEHFRSLDSFRKVSFILGSEQWEDKFGVLLDLCVGTNSS